MWPNIFQQTMHSTKSQLRKWSKAATKCSTSLNELFFKAWKAFRKTAALCYRCLHSVPLCEGRQGAKSKPKRCNWKRFVSEIKECKFYLTQKQTEKLKLLHLNDQVSGGGRLHPLAWLFMHIGTQGGEINKLPMSLHPTTPKWLRWSCGIHLLCRGKNLNAATGKRAKQTAVCLFNNETCVMSVWRTAEQSSAQHFLYWM